MAGNLTFHDLAGATSTGQIDTVLACIIDMQGRLMGKRFHAQHFVDSAWEESHFCDYLLATDFKMTPVEGYASSSWTKGYGDYIMKPDMTTLRSIPWLEGTALVLCDILDHHHKEIPHSPRAILKRQVARLAKLGFSARAATELEFFIFEQSYGQLQDQNHRDLKPLSGYNQDYHIFETTKQEGVMRAIRNGLVGAGIPVENTKGEAETGQQEVNVRYGAMIDTADNHAIIKNACKEIAWQQNQSATFLAKWHQDKVGSSSHIHQSLWDRKNQSAFFDPKALYGMSSVMRNYVAGLLKYADECMYFLAPNVNSYKRFAVGTFAPTKAVWSVDNRTAGFRLCGADTLAVRVECRIGGSDLNPYLALACQLAAGIAGIKENLKLGDPISGDVYHDDKITVFPRTLDEALAALDRSKMLRTAFGKAVIDHYLHAGRWELEERDRVVTDWEIARGFEQA